MALDVDTVNSDIIEIWDNHADVMERNQPDDDPPWPRWPALYDDLNPHPDVLYVGLNPSFVHTQIERRIEEAGYHLELKDLRWEGYRDDVASFLQDERKIAKRDYSYFKPMRDFAAEENLEWEHIDVFVTRLTSQGKLDDTLEIELFAEGENQSKFLKRQVDLFFELLENLRPRVVVVENAFARDFLKNTRLSNEQYNLTPEDGVAPDTGYQTVEIAEETPIFFSGMLSGQRALDIGSRQRLEWHITQSLES